MAKSKKHIPGITSRFLQICTEVVRDGLVKTETAFAESVGEHQQNLSLMKKGSRAPSLEIIANGCLQYGYSANWLLLGKGDKKLKAVDQKSLEERVNDLETQVQSIKRSIKTRSQKR